MAPAVAGRELLLSLLSSWSGKQEWRRALGRRAGYRPVKVHTGIYNVLLHTAPSNVDAAALSLPLEQGLLSRGAGRRPSMQMYGLH